MEFDQATRTATQDSGSLSETAPLAIVTIENILSGLQTVVYWR